MSQRAILQAGKDQGVSARLWGSGAHFREDAKRLLAERYAVLPLCFHFFGGNGPKPFGKIRSHPSAH